MLRRVQLHLQQPSRRILDPLDRKPIGTKNPGELKPFRRIDREDLESITELQGGRGGRMNHGNVT